MKVIVKQVTTATIIALLLIGITVHAEGTEHTALKNENIETTLELENWMTDETIWNTNSIFYAEFVEETETCLEVEEWMFNTASWNIYYCIETENDKALELESWMTNSLNWEVDMEMEPALTLDLWMMDENLWK